MRPPVAEVVPFPGGLAKATAAAGDDGETTPHLRGQCECGSCGHEWEAVVPVGVVHIECPECLRLWGALVNAVEPGVAWACDCGERLFWLTPEGALCRRCGVVCSGWDR